MYKAIGGMYKVCSFKVREDKKFLLFHNFVVSRKGKMRRPLFETIIWHLYSCTAYKRNSGELKIQVILIHDEHDSLVCIYACALYVVVNIYLNRIYYLLLRMIQAAEAGDVAGVTKSLYAGEDVNQKTVVSVLSVATFNYAPTLH
jgi:hypothetical protein